MPSLYDEGPKKRSGRKYGLRFFIKMSTQKRYGGLSVVGPILRKYFIKRQWDPCLLLYRYVHTATPNASSRFRSLCTWTEVHYIWTYSRQQDHI